MWKKFAKRVQMLVGRALLESITSDGDIQLVKLSVLDGEDYDQLERPQNYGLSANPSKGGEIVLLSVQGNKDDGIIILMDDSQYRKKVDKGEVALYSKFAAYIHLRKDGKMELSGIGDNGVRYASLETAYNQLKADHDSHTHPFTGTISIPNLTCAGNTTATPVGSAGNIAPAKIVEIEVPS